MALSFVEEIERHAATRNVTIYDLKLIQDNFYTMEGSAIRGDMIGGAKPAELALEIQAEADDDVIREIVLAAEKSSAAQAYNRDIHENTFALSCNDVQVPVRRVTESRNQRIEKPSRYFDALQPLAGAYQADILVKQEAAKTLFDVEGGAGSSLKSDQKRTLHVRGIVIRRDDGLREVAIQLFKPIGSTFRFISDPTNQERAPASLEYLSAGVGFCFMTQIGRYAHIVKQELRSYEIVQDNIYGTGDSVVTNEPVDTHVYIDFDHSTEDAQQIVHMSEQTCFLHAAMRSAVPSNITIRAGEREVSL
jgi:uncharacterized OsmC-like protein